jgi:hypothetical protein
LVTCYLNGYANTGTAQTYSYPTASTLTLPANASMTAETCNIVAIGQ